MYITACVIQFKQLQYQEVRLMNCQMLDRHRLFSGFEGQVWDYHFINDDGYFFMLEALLVHDLELCPKADCF